MPRTEFASLLDHLTALVSDQLWEAAYLHAERVTLLAQNGWQAGQVLHQCVQVPAALRRRPDWAALLAYTAFRANDVACCEAHLLDDTPEGAVLRAWTLLCRGEAATALELSEHSLRAEKLDGALSRIAWRMRGWALASLHQPGWELAFREAAARNMGRQRGIALLQFGGFLSYAGRDAEARSAYAEAAPHFAHDPELRANALYNVGTACLRLCELPAAERAYQAARGWATKPEGKKMLPRTWSGLGHVYRAFGELSRAMYAYGVSQAKATEVDDVSQAWRGMAHTFRLSGRLDDALSTLQEGLDRLASPEQHELYADLAAVQLTLGDDQGARRSLEQVIEGQEEERQRTLIVRAELARRSGDDLGARALLSGLTFEALWVAEETRLWPELFALVGRSAPAPATLRLKVEASGPVRAFLNGRPLTLRATASSASLLALLALHGGGIAVRSTLDWLRLNGENKRRKEQNLSRAVVELRDILGWPGAVRHTGGTIQLDPNIVCEALGLPLRSADFCAGLEDPWIEQWREDHDDVIELIRS